MPCDTILALLGMSSGNHKLKMFRQLLNELEQTTLSPTCTECRWIKKTQEYYTCSMGMSSVETPSMMAEAAFAAFPFPFPFPFPFFGCRDSTPTYTTLSLSRGYLTMFCQESVSPFLCTLLGSAPAQGLFIVACRHGYEFK